LKSIISKAQKHWRAYETAFFSLDGTEQKRPYAAIYIFREFGYTFMLDKPSALFGREQWSTVVLTTTAHRNAQT
jgi:hypothetical protein